MKTKERPMSKIVKTDTTCFFKKDAHRNLTKFAPGFVHTAPVWSRFMKKLFCTILGKGFTGKLVKNIGPASKKRRQGILELIQLIHMK